MYIQPLTINIWKSKLGNPLNLSYVDLYIHIFSLKKQVLILESLVVVYEFFSCVLTQDFEFSS